MACRVEEHIAPRTSHTHTHHHHPSLRPQIRGIKTNLPFLENVLRHPEFLSGEATTFFIEKNSRDLFNFERHGSLRSSKLLTYLADMVVNGPDHPGAIGAPPSKFVPAALEVEDPKRRLTGWRDVLLDKGPDGWAKAVRAHKGVLITDTTMWVTAGQGARGGWVAWP